MNNTLGTFIPNYNHGHLIERALSGVFDQELIPDQVIVYDDGSTDNSVEIVKRLQKKWPQITLIEGGKNIGGIHVSRKGMDLIQTRWINYLAADDAPASGIFAKAMAMADKYPDAGIIMGQMRITHEQTGAVKVTGVQGWDEPQYVSPDRFLNEYMRTHLPNHGLGSGTLWRKDALVECGGFRADLFSWCDTFAARAMALEYGAIYLPYPVVEKGYSETCYSHRMGRDMDVMLKVIDRGVQLMRSEQFRNLFPASYVYGWRRDYIKFLEQL
ncbi:glycosyltransferase family 2 protein [Oceanidesulfovibrio marinus]|nr:glycosyltransferase family A protein [Oceanidesulfovibrio marinus]